MNKKLERVKYKKSALREVIFQVRFPSILRIDTELPSAFQEEVRQKYPMFTDNCNETTVNINGQNQVVSKNHNYEFISADGKSRINLTNSFIAISTLNYDRWELFKVQCKEIYDIFLKIYSPAMAQRIGLRYKDLITRSKWDLKDCTWKDLIKEHELGILAELPEEKINGYVLDFEISGEDGVNEHRHFQLVRETATPTENSFLIDCDYFIQGILQVGIAFDQSEILHNHSSNFIRSVITDKLNSIMEPEQL